MKRALIALGLLLSVACGGTQHTATPQPGIDDVRARAAARPNDPVAQSELAIAEFLMDGGDASRVQEQTERALALSPDDERLHLVAGLEAYLHGHPSVALGHVLSTLDKASASRRPNASAVAEVASAALEELANITPEFRERTAEAIAARLATPGRLGPATTQTLTDSLIIAAYQRGDREAVTAAAAAQGCVPEWRVAGPFGPRELLGFDTRHGALAAGPLADEYDLGPFQGTRPTRMLESRGCGVHLGGGPTPSGGTTYAEAFVEVPSDGDYVVRLETPNSVELYIDDVGSPVVRLDLRHMSSPRVTFHRVTLSAGRHELTVKVTSRHPNPILMVSLTGDDGRAMAAHASTGAEFTGALPEGDDALSIYLRAAVSTARGDVVGAREALRQAGDASATVLATRAAVALSDPMRPADMRRDEARRLLRRMRDLDQDAWFPALQLARLAATDGRDVHAISELREHTERWPEMLAFPLSLAEMLLGRGWDAEADRAIRAARVAVPDACAPLRAQLSSAQRRDRTAIVEASIEALQACDARTNVRFSQALRTRRWDIAAAELDRLAALEPAQSRVQILGSRLEVARGRADMAQLDRLLEGIAAERPRSSSTVLAQVDRLLAQDRHADALGALEAALVRDPESMAELRLTQRSLGGDDIMAPYRVDGAEVLTSFEASGREYDQPQVLVLDYTVMRVFEDHSALELTHNIIRLQSEEAVDAQGEFQAPEGAELLRLQTVKADGTRLEPDLIAGKDTISMPSLAIGDYVEFEYVRVIDAPRGLPNAVLGTRFFFRSFEVPFDRSELTLVMPSQMEPVIDPRGPAPETQMRIEGDLRILRWGVSESRPLIQEPGSVSMREYMPSISWGVNARWQPFLDGLRDVLADRDIVDPAAERLARVVLGEGAATDMAKARLLYNWVLANIENNNDVFGLAPSMLAGRTGNRARVLHYLLGLSGVASDLVLVRSYGSDQTRSELADDDTYSFLVVRVGTGSDAKFLVTTARGTPFGYVPAALRGQDALVLSAADNRITLPAGDESPDHHDIEALAVLAADGSARVTVIESFRGAGAIQWRGDLEGIAAALLEQRFEEGYVSRLMPGASLVSLRITGQDNADEPLALRYTFDVPALGRRQGGHFIVPGLFPSNLSPTFARLATRTTAQLMTTATAVDVRLRIQTPDGTPAPEDLAAVHLEGPNGARFEASSATVDGETLIERTLRMPRMRVSSDDYAAFARFCREADQGEARELSLSL